jgi:hypothetical protein
VASSQGRVFGRTGNRQALNHIEQKGGTEGEVTRQSARDRQRRPAPKAKPASETSTSTTKLAILI